MATANKFVIPFTIHMCVKYEKGPPKLSMFPTEITLQFGLKMKGRTWKKNRGPRSSLDRLGLSIMMMTHTTTTAMTEITIIQ